MTTKEKLQRLVDSLAVRMNRAEDVATDGLMSRSSRQFSGGQSSAYSTAIEEIEEIIRDMPEGE